MAGCSERVDGLRRSTSRRPCLSGTEPLYLLDGSAYFTGCRLRLSEQAAQTGFSSCRTGFRCAARLHLLLIGVIDIATFASPYYQPSLEPNVGMALTSRVARRILPVFLMVAGISMFGAIRFGIRTFVDYGGKIGRDRRLAWAWLPASGGVIVWLCLRAIQCDQSVQSLFEWSATDLAAAAAELTVRFPDCSMAGSPGSPDRLGRRDSLGALPAGTGY